MKRIWILIIVAGVLCACGQEKERKNAGPGPEVPEGTEIGQRAPEILLENPEGKEIALSSLRGKVVLLDFWASWCAPCRAENPRIVAQYEKYRKKDFTVYSVSLDLKKEDWVKAIEKDGLSWPNHVSDLKFWYSEAASRYNINQLPANFVLDEDGIILAKDLRGDELEEFLNKLLSN